MLNKIIVWLPEDQFLKADGFDEAIIGLEVSTNRLIYSVSKCIKILSEQMEEEEAVEYFEYNIRGAYVGELTPIFCQDNF
jgi:hypothetical protein